MMNQRDELLIQRCVDNECTEDERQQLLKRLDEIPDGWKNLACTYMEEQLFAAACVAELHAAPATLKKAGQQARTPNARTRHWFYHPYVSLALTSCVMFLIGVIVRGELLPGDRFQPPDSRSPLITSNNQSPPSTYSRSAQAAPAYTMQFESDGMAPQQLPVYEDVAEFFSVYEQFQQRDLRQIPANLRYVGGRQSELKFLRVPTDEGHSIVVPVQEFQVAPRFQ